jgi:hypothetical protein
MSDVLISTSRCANLRYFGPAILADVSESGMAILMDEVPKGYTRMHVKNSYFEVNVEIRNVTRTGDGCRVGCEFIQPVEWRNHLAMLIS